MTKKDLQRNKIHINLFKNILYATWSKIELKNFRKKLENFIYLLKLHWLKTIIIQITSLDCGKQTSNKKTDYRQPVSR